MDRSSRSEEHFLTGYSGKIFIVITVGGLVTHLGRQALPLLLPTICDELAISSAAAGFAMTMMQASFAIAQYPSGRMADKMSRKVGIVGGLVVLIGGFIFLTQAQMYFIFLLSTVLLGIGSGFFFVVSRVLLSDIFVSKRGTAFGLNGAIGRIGSVSASAFAVGALIVGSWNVAFVPIIILLLVVVLLFHMISKEPYRFNMVRMGIRESIGRVFGTSETRWLVVAYTLVIFAWEGSVVFLPEFLITDKNLSIEHVGVGFSILFAAGIIIQPVSGHLSDRWDRRFIAGITPLVSIIGLISIISMKNLLLIFIGIFLYSTGVMAFTPVMQAHLMDLFPDTSKGGDLGVFKTVYEGVSSLGPTYVGVVAGFTSYTTAFFGFFGCFFASVVVLFWLQYSSRFTQ